MVRVAEAMAEALAAAGTVKAKKAVNLEVSAVAVAALEEVV